MKQSPENPAAPRRDPAAADPGSQGGEDSRRVQGREPEAAHYDPSGRWTERPGSDPYHEEEDKREEDGVRERFARGAEWDFRPDAAAVKGSAPGAARKQKAKH